MDSSIDIDSNILNSSFKNSNIELCSIYLAESSNLNNSDIESSCEIDNSRVDGANLTQGRVVVE